MKIGPLEVIICAFPKPTIDATVIKALSETVKSGAVALADLALVSRDGQGVVHVRDLQDDLPAAWSGMIRDSRPLTLLNDADLELAAETIGSNEIALVAVVEHRWAQRLSEEVRRSGGVTALQARIPQEDAVIAIEADGVTTS
ncbi:MAG TPA: DUF6325 family protein [Arthrobacter sp.]|jgi:hypothetical protein|uniref:DUF6325 family protein n=1 Tax=Pseudarthrobacter oxydans TaxID=1671 RepID=UPI0027814E9A|nr:DUF6325 family protein [Pseudarthrobacter oxydans]MDP9983739.1 hypothetical protein [Pseudarthrobacter oxydans]HET9349148.1 DUF6325 family protein [Arthrobacter sp.]